MKSFGVALAMGLCTLILVVIILNHFGEGQAELRSERAALALQEVREMAPLRLAVNRVLTASVGVGGAAVALILATAAVVALFSVPNLVRIMWLRSWLVKPNQHALYPALARPDGAGHITVLNPPNERLSQPIAALTGGNVDRLGGAGQVVKQLTNPKDPDFALSEPEPPPLPQRASIYTAPLSDQLHLPIGADGNGPVQLPLRDLGSGIVGGLPGMGKSECVASMIAGLLRQDATGTRIQLAVADLKGGVDFGRIPGDLAGLAWPVAKDPETGLALVNHVWDEIERRQQLLERAGVARVEVYNQRPGVQALPYLFLFVDELAMVTMAAEERGMDKSTRQQSAEFNGRAVRVVSVGRALGVSMIGATQRPSGTVIPTQLRDLCGFRIAFRCMTQESSKAVLGVSGAETLPAEPGLALLMRDGAQPRMIRTYLAEIEAGRFDAFTRRLPRAERIQLPADAEADGLGADDQPSTPGTTTGSATVASTAGKNGPFKDFQATSTTVVPPVAPPVALTLEQRIARVPKDRPPTDPYDSETLYLLWREAQHSSAEVERKVYGYDGGAAKYYAACGINAALRRRGRPAQYKEKDPDVRK
jgi:hypothetical protein